MTSTVTAATLTVTLTESITLNGVDHGGTNTLSIGSINEVYKRIVTATTTETEILSFHASLFGPGQFLNANVRYIRITNLDDTNNVVLTFKNQDNDECAMLLDKGQSFIFNGDLTNGVQDVINAITAGNVTPTLSCVGDLSNITVWCDTASCDIEIFVASI